MKYTVFGESHGPAIGITIAALPAGIKLDWDFINSEMQRRAPGNSKLTTQRKEADNIEILSGIFEDKTTGTPLCAIIRNTNTRSKDYDQLKDMPRPSHGDYTGNIRYNGFNDYRGGGHFSGRLTAPIVFAGAIAKQILREKGIEINANISMVGGINNPTETELNNIITQARDNLDSVGGAIACEITGLPPGLGSPDFGCNVEGIISQYMFSVPAVKAIGFGAGFKLATMFGSIANDPFILKDGKIATKTNHSGGINGGITNGMPVTFEVAIRPTPSIARPQKTVSLSRMEEVNLEIHGRHDPCIVLRAVVVIEAAAALAVSELLNI